VASGGGVDIARRGLADAIERLRAWIEAGDYDSPSPVADALAHVYTLESGHRRGLGDQPYFEARSADPAGDIVGALVWARGLLQHHAADSAVITGRRPFTMGRSTMGGGDVMAGRGVEVLWRDRSDLPPRDPDTHGRDAMYDRHLAGRDVI